MPRFALRAGILLLLVLFVGAQFHFCADLTSAPAASHFCPVCSATSSVMATEAASLLIAPVSHRLEAPGTPLQVSIEFPRTISPRAPPSAGSAR